MPSHKFLLLVSLFCLFSCQKSSPKSPLQQSIEYLWAQQGEDGGWHSPKHGIMKGGQAHTAFILFALLEIPQTIYKPCPEAVGKGLDFIRNHIDENGTLGLSDPYVMEYPNYATSYALRVLSKYGEAKDTSLIREMTHYLIHQQYVEERGILPEHHAYGSWGFGEKGIPLGKTGHIDISHTRKVIQALAESGLEDPAIYQKTKTFLSLVQKHPNELRPQPELGNLAPSFPEEGYSYDGGFYSSPIVIGANKAKYDSEKGIFPSYATATCDGILAYLACGLSPESEPVAKANDWLKNHSNLNFPEGIPTNDPDQWHRVLVIYHLWGRSEVYKALNWEENKKIELFNTLTSLQNEDGSFANSEGARNKEDDPLLATAMAVMVMRNL